MIVLELLKTIISLLKKIIILLKDLMFQGIDGVSGNFLNGLQKISNDISLCSWQAMMCLMVLGGVVYMTGHTSLGKKFCRRSFWGWTFFNLFNLIFQCF